MGSNSNLLRSYIMVCLLAFGSTYPLKELRSPEAMLKEKRNRPRGAVCKKKKMPSEIRGSESLLDW